MTTTTRSIRRRLGLACRAVLATLALLAAGPALAQAINDVPMAVKNNVPPNFMFMIDSSGSMNNIVPTAPYNPAIDYAPAGCTSVLAAGTSVRLTLSSGAPRIRVGSTDYRHWSLSGTGTDRRCFNRTAVYDGYLMTGTVYLGAAYDGNYLNWYFSLTDSPSTATTPWTNRKVVTLGSVLSRLDIAKTSASSVINTLPVDNTTPVVRVGLSEYNGSDGGELNVNLNGLTSSQRTTVLSKVAGMTGDGNTPLAETLADLGRYLATGYSDNIETPTVSGVTINNFLKQDARQSCLRNNTGSGSTSNFCENTTTDPIPASPSIGTTSRPIQYWCQRSYAFLLTDGRPNADQAFTTNTYLRDYDGSCTGSCIPGAGSPTGIATNQGWDRKLGAVDPRTYEWGGSDYLDDVAKALFEVDLRPNLPSPDPTNRPKKNNLLTYTIGFADLQVQNDPLLINTARQGGGLFLSAQDGPSLTTAFNKVIADAFSKDAAAAAVAVANAQITLNNTGYASSYKSGAWYGDLVAYSLNTSSALQTGSNIWSLRENLDLQGTNRKIATYNGSAGVAFASTLSYSGMPASLTAGVINYLRGDRSGEGSTYRARQSVLGDIINAEPVVVNYSGNVPIIFQGANDGMLHVVDGRTDASVATRGQELWAYVPKMLHGGLGELSGPNYGLVSPNYTHRYYIDGTPAAAEITGFSFSRLLVGGLGKGGRGYYALDISSYEAANEAAAASKVLWEFSPSGMGYSFGTPLIVKTAAGWRVVVASGYDASVTGQVWVLDPASGAVLASIDTGVSSAGLAHLSRLANTAPDALVRYVWGGDLQGNVWRFDLDTGTAMRIAALTDAGGTLAQPITSPPEVGAVAGSSTKFMVQVGTGRYLADEDVPGAGQNTWATQRQSVYGLIDDTTIVIAADALLSNARGTNGSTCPTGGGNGSLVCQTLSYVSASNTYSATAHPVDPATRRGWYIDLPLDTNLTHSRVVSKPALTTGGTLTLTVNIPTNVQCDPGGSSWFLALNGATGGAVPRNVGGNTYFDSVGFFLGYALASRPVIVTTADGKRALIRMSDKTVKAPPVPEAASTAAQWRRIYWRQVN